MLTMALAEASLAAPCQARRRPRRPGRLGIAIGLAVLASSRRGLAGENWLVGVVITATFFHEMVGPVVVERELKRWARAA